MGLNKSTGNMYSFLDYTWNPLVGQCPHGCTYCSTNKLKAKYLTMKELYSGKPRLNENQFKTNLGSGKFIFVCAQNDLFADDILNSMIKRVLEHCVKYPKNKYLFQTKNPRRMNTFLNVAYLRGQLDCVGCTTIETNRSYPKIMKNSPSVSDRAKWIHGFVNDRYVTIEPIMDFDLDPMVELIKQCNPVQVNIGADSGNNNLPEPPLEKVLELIERLKEFTTISKKKNLERLIK